MITTLTLIAALLAAPSLPSRTVAISATVSGISGEDLADTPLSDAIDMEDGTITNQLSLTVAVTPGTTTVVDVRCYESQDNTNYDAIALCDTSNPSDCVPDVRRYTLSNYTASGGVYYLASRWPTTKRWVKCSLDDASDGTGTAVLTGARSWR